MASKEEVKAAWEEAFAQIDLEKLIKDAFLDGFDTYEDYVKYGDAIIRIDRRPKPAQTIEITPIERRLTDGRSPRSD